MEAKTRLPGQPRPGATDRSAASHDHSRRCAQVSATLILEMRLAVNLIALGLMLAAYFGLWHHYWPQLPEQLATHWGPSGEADDWMERGAFFQVFTSIAMPCVAAMVAVSFGVTALPPSLVNIPGRDYWLAPERRRETMAVVRVMLLEGTNGTVAFLLVVLWSILRANVDGHGELPPMFFWALVSYFIAVVVWTIALVVRFRRPTTTMD